MSSISGGVGFISMDSFSQGNYGPGADLFFFCPTSNLINQKQKQKQKKKKKKKKKKQKAESQYMDSFGV